MFHLPNIRFSEIFKSEKMRRQTPCCVRQKTARPRSRRPSQETIITIAVPSVWFPPDSTIITRILPEPWQDEKSAHERVEYRLNISTMPGSDSAATEEAAWYSLFLVAVLYRKPKVSFENFYKNLIRGYKRCLELVTLHVGKIFINSALPRS